MTAQAAQSTHIYSNFEKIRYATEILRTESQALLELGGRLGGDFCQAVDILYGCAGCILVSGMGKAGWIGQKISATFASTGSVSHFLHPSEAMHGDLGRVTEKDAVLLLSNSGNTEEITRLLAPLQERKTPLIAITGHPASSLGKAADVVLDLGPIQEACSLGLAPTTSTTAMLALGDALALVTSRMKGFQAEDFARFHPGGSLGRKLSKVEEVMRPLEQCRVAPADMPVREMLVYVSRPGRRTGAIMLVDESGKLCGLFTDSDLARLLETRQYAALDGPASAVMNKTPLSIEANTMLPEAVALLAKRKFSELPVTDTSRRVVGLLDITDVVGLEEPKPGQEVKKKEYPLVRFGA